MKKKTLINKFSLPANAEWPGTQNKTAMFSTIIPLFRKIILCTLPLLLLLGAVKTAAQDYSMALVNVDNVSDDSSLELDGAASVTTAVVDGTTYLFVAGNQDDGVSVFSVANNGLLTSVQDVDDADDVNLELNGAGSVTTAVVDGTTYLFVAGVFDDGVSVFSVANNGMLASVTNVNDAGMRELDGAGSVTTAVVADTTRLFVAGFNDSGVSVFSVANDDGMLTSVTNVPDAGMLELSGAQSVTTAVVGTTTYLFVAGFLDSGVSVFSVANNGMLASVTNVPDAGMLELSGAQSVTTAVVDGTTYLFVAGNQDDGVSVFRVGDTGALANVTNVTDAGSLELNGASSVTTAVVDGTTCLFVAGNQDDGVSVFSVANNGMLTNVTNVPDAGSLNLDFPESVTTAVVGTTTYLFVAGFTDDGVSVFRVEDAAAPTFGSETASDQTFAISCGAVSLQLPEATSGNGTLTYTLTPAIPGLTLDPVTGMLSGTPATPAAAVALTYTVTDEDYNLTDADSPSLTFMVTVTADDNIAPDPDMTSLPALTGECSVTLAMAMAAAPIATDNCDAGTIPGTTDAAPFPITTNSMITWTFTDMAGNMITQTQQVTITPDMTGPAPVEASLSALTGECSVTLAMAMAAAPTATDNCDAGTITGTTDAAPFPITTNSMITWTFTDMAGNMITQTQQVTITPDMTGPAPVEASLSALTGECSVTLVMAMAAAPTATDNCDVGTITGTTDAAPFPITTTSTITWTYEDSEGNTTTQEQQVTLMDVTGPAPEEDPLLALTGECSVTLAMAMAAAPTATDNCDATPTATTDAAPFPITTTSTITWTYEDSEGNATTQEQQVTLMDVTGPAPVEASLSALTGECSVTMVMAMAAAPTATDNCDTGTITGITDAASFPITTTSTITWTYEDSEGNATTQDQQVTLMDVTGPAPVEASLSALTGECSVMPAAPTATDNCDTGTITGTTTTSLPVTSTSVITWTFTDEAGNETRQTQQVTITDATRPVPDETSLSALTGECRVNMPAAPTAMDNCDTGSITGTTDAIFPITADATITWTFTDVAGNMATQTQQVTLNCISPLGVEEELGISMYPNPSEGSLAFSTGNYGSFFVKIYRIDGALVFAGSARDNTPINIETLAAGSYVVQVTANGTTVFTSRLLKRD